MEPHVDYFAIALQLTMTGMLVVFSGLVLLFLLISTFNYFDERQRQKKQGDLTAQAVATKPVIADGVTPEVIAIISAAVHEAISQPVRIKRIRYGKQSDATWSRQGRITVMGSHYIKR